MKKKILLIIILFTNLAGKAQFGNDYWLAGAGNLFSPNGLGIYRNFIQNTEFFLDTNIQIPFNYTHAAINRNNGELLFYTNGKQVANKNHELMPNGDSLFNYSSQWDLYFTGSFTPQGALILPDPGDTNLFYLLHTSYHFNGLVFPPENLYFSKIDMRLNNGLGDVVDKNQILLQDSLWTGFISATRHANGRDWWILMNRFRTNHFYKILLSPAGFSFYEQDIGPPIDSYGLGNVCFSPDGKYFAYYDWYYDLHLYEFDRCTGELSNLVQVPVDDSATCGGFAFSPNSRFGYITTCKYVYQVDLQATDIAASRVKIATTDYFVDPEYGYQVSFYLPVLTSDSLIYIIGNNSVKFLHTIHQPDLLGLSSNLLQHDVELPKGYGLTIPNRVNFNLGPVTGSICDSLMLSVRHEVIVNKSIFIFPNPFTNVLQISNPEFENNSLFRIYNALGVLVLERKFTSANQNIDLSALSSGIYRAAISNKVGQVVKNEKLIKID
jgi:hypothetical protein